MKPLAIVIAVLVILGGAIYFATNKVGGDQLDTFARCLKDNGAIFYGAFWCPHCQNQKAIFGSSAKFLPYVECSTSDGKSQLQICSDKKVTGYPTWEFKDGTRESGEVSLERLAEKTGCALPDA